MAWRFWPVTAYTPWRFEWCSRADLVNDLEPYVQIRIIQELALGAGHHGMVGGQVMDVQAENQRVELEELRTIHAHKTGKLIRAAVRAGPCYPVPI